MHVLGVCVALYPQDPEFKSITPLLEQKTDISSSDNGRGQAVGRAGGSIEFDCKYNRLTYLEAMRVRGFIAGLQGQLHTCDLILPVESYSQADHAGSTPRVSALTSPGTNSVTFKDALPNKTLRYAGEWVQFAGHDKAYMLAQDMVSDGSGAGTIYLAPATYEQLLENEQIIIDEIVFKVNVNSDILKTPLSKGAQYTFSVKFTEAIR